MLSLFYLTESSYLNAIKSSKLQKFFRKKIRNFILKIIFKYQKNIEFLIITINLNRSEKKIYLCVFFNFI